MAKDTASTCLECDAALPRGSDKCPGCGCVVVYCAASTCGVPYPAELNFCPFCNTPKSSPAPPAPPPAIPRPPISAEPEAAPAAAGAFSLADAIARAQGGAAAPAPMVQAPVRGSERPPPVPALVRPQPPTVSDLAAPALRTAPPAVPGAAPPVPRLPPSLAAPRLELLVTRAPRKGEQCVVRLRATLLGVAQHAALDLRAECDLLPNRQVVLQTALATGVPQELPSLKGIPQAAGAEVIRFEATLKGPEGIPLGRWSASKDLIVEDVVAPTGPITAEKGATVIVSAGPFAGMANALQGMGALPPSWQPTPLQPDSAFQLRLRNACPDRPASGPAPPPDAKRLWPASQALHAALRVENARTGQRICAAVVCAHAASFGRGGDPAVAWWLSPAPFDQAQHTRLSRRHTALTLRAGRAWVTDHSTNGTFLNRQPILRDAPEMLSQGDSVDPAGVVPLTVSELCVERQKVHALWADRRDGLAGRLRYLLTDGTAPVPVRHLPEEPPALWIAWLRGPESAPLLAAWVPGGRWFAVAPGKNVLLEPFRVFWGRFEEPCEQEHYLPS